MTSSAILNLSSLKKLGIASLASLTLILSGCSKEDSSTIDSSMLEEVANSDTTNETDKTLEESLSETAADLGLEGVTLADSTQTSVSVPQIAVGVDEFSDGNILLNLPGELMEGGPENVSTHWIQTKGTPAYMVDTNTMSAQALLPLVKNAERLNFRLFAINNDSLEASYKDFSVTVLPYVADIFVDSQVVDIADGEITFNIQSALGFPENILFNYTVEPATPGSTADFSSLNSSAQVTAGENTQAVNIPFSQALFAQSNGLIRVWFTSTNLEIPIRVSALGVIENTQENVSNNLSLENDAELTFQPVGASVTLKLANYEFNLDTQSLVASINNTPIPAESITISANEIVFNSVLVDGANAFSFQHQTTSGEILSYQSSFWAGNNSVTVNFIDEAGEPISETVAVTVTLTDNTKITALKTAEQGSVVFDNLPARTLLLSAVSQDSSRTGTTSFVGSNTQALNVVLEGIGEVSDVDNNDFSMGTSGWVTPNDSAVSVVVNPETQDNDLVLTTFDEGEQRLSRTFQSQEGTTGIRVRYRFITEEFPNFFGSQYNDTFSVSIKTASGDVISEAGSMNALGEDAFSTDGETSWRDAVLPVNVGGEIIQVTITVANVGDGAYDSKVVVDFVEELIAVDG